MRCKMFLFLDDLPLRGLFFFQFRLLIFISLYILPLISLSFHSPHFLHCYLFPWKCFPSVYSYIFPLCSCSENIFLTSLSLSPRLFSLKIILHSSKVVVLQTFAAICVCVYYFAFSAQKKTHFITCSAYFVRWPFFSRRSPMMIIMIITAMMVYFSHLAVEDKKKEKENTMIQKCLENWAESSRQCARSELTEGDFSWRAGLISFPRCLHSPTMKNEMCINKLCATESQMNWAICWGARTLSRS